MHCRARCHPLDAFLPHTALSPIPVSFPLSLLPPCEQVINTELKDKVFQHGKVPMWTTTILENTLKELAQVNGEAAKKGGQKYKYVVNAQLQQNTGSALITATSAYWDKSTDSHLCVRWENEEVQVLVTVFGIAV